MKGASFHRNVDRSRSRRRCRFADYFCKKYRDVLHVRGGANLLYWSMSLATILHGAVTTHATRMAQGPLEQTNGGGTNIYTSDKCEGSHSHGAQACDDTGGGPSFKHQVSIPLTPTSERKGHVRRPNLRRERSCFFSDGERKRTSPESKSKHSPTPL